MSAPPSGRGSCWPRRWAAPGRGERPGRAIIQTYLPDHPVDRGGRGGGRPAVRGGGARPAPAVRVAAVRPARSSSPRRWRTAPQAEAVARRLAERLRERAAREGRRVAVLGPVPAYVARRGGRWRFHVVLRGDDPMALLGADPGMPVERGRGPGEPPVGRSPCILRA